MSEIKHTPGPWNVDPAYPMDVQAGGIEVCSVMADDDVGEEWEIQGPCTDHDTAVANALLIAAAPEMYEALEWLETYARVQVDRYPDAEDNKGWERILSALAKARGEA